MGNIFDIVLDNDTNNQFQIRGNVKHILIEDFGAILKLNARFRSDRNELVSIGDFNHISLTDNVRIIIRVLRLWRIKPRKWGRDSITD